MPFSKPSRVRAALAAMFLGGAVFATGCTSGLGPNDFSRTQAGKISRVDEGEIVSVRAVQFEGSRSGVGTGAGAIIGGAAGQSLGGDDAGRIVGGVAGAVLGGLAGAAIEEGATQSTGFAYTIRLDRNGELITVAQGGETPFAPGTRVFIEYGPQARVVPQQSFARF